MIRGTVASAMTRDPVAVAPHTRYKDILELLAERGVSAVPVVSATGRVLGVVSEADLLRGPRRRHGDGRLTAVELMTSPAVTVTPDTALADASRLIVDSGRRRVFVVDGQRLVGVLSLRDLLGEFRRPDKEILAEVEHEVLDAARSVRVAVDGGVVQLTGRLPQPSGANALVARISRIPGVIAIKERTR